MRRAEPKQHRRTHGGGGHHERSAKGQLARPGSGEGSVLVRGGRLGGRRAQGGGDVGRGPSRPITSGYGVEVRSPSSTRRAGPRAGCPGSPARGPATSASGRARDDDVRGQVGGVPPSHGSPPQTESLEQVGQLPALARGRTTAKKSSSPQVTEETRRDRRERLAAANDHVASQVRRYDRRRNVARRRDAVVRRGLRHVRRSIVEQPGCSPSPSSRAACTGP